MLYIVATPIGNLEDLSVRAVKTLSAVDYILAEDTRHTLILLRHYNITKPLISFHEHNEHIRCAQAIADIQAGKSIALVSDAGTPLISDPGFLLVQKAIQEKVPYTTIPGPCSAIAALTLSGFAPTPFQCIGFLPKSEGRRKRALENALQYPGTTIFFESPKRALKTLKTLISFAPLTPIVICRELTKKFEQVLSGTAQELFDACTARPLKGELVFLIPEGHTHRGSTDHIEQAALE